MFLLGLTVHVNVLVVLCPANCGCLAHATTFLEYAVNTVISNLPLYPASKLPDSDHARIMLVMNYCDKNKMDYVISH
jgi:hypothetical protein